MNLLAANLERFSARRLTRVMLFLALGLVVAIVAFQTVRGHRFTTQEPSYFFAPDGNGSGVQFSPAMHDTRIDVAANLSNVLTVVGILLMCVSFVLGASFVGAETGGSSLSTQLLYEPRRWRQHLAKTIAVAVSCAAIALCVCCVIAATMLLGSHLHGIAPHVRSDWWTARAREIARVALASALAGVMAYAVTLVVKRTGAGVIVFLLQIPLAATFMRSEQPGTHVSLLAKISRSSPYYGLQILALGRSHLPNVQYMHGVTTSAAGFALAGVWAVLLLLGAGALFARAEVR